MRSAFQVVLLSLFIPDTKKYLVGTQQRQFYLWGKGVSLHLVGHHSRDGVTIKTPYRFKALLHRPALHPIGSQ